MAVKVGDVVAWDKVPSGALVLRRKQRIYDVRHGDDGRCVAVGKPSETHWDGCAEVEPWGWLWGEATEPVTIIALDVPADATADDLRTLAEAFEVREASWAQRTHRPMYSPSVASTMALALPAVVRMIPNSGRWAALSLELTAFAHCLHRAGWRPGMTAEDAARLLAEVRDGEI